MKIWHWVILWVLSFFLIFGLLVCAMSYAQDGTIVVTVKDFSKPMTPGLSPLINDPEGIAKSENMYVTQLGTRQLRFGFRNTTTSPPVDSPVTSLIHFVPSNDSAALIYTAGGKWWAQKTGIYKYGIRSPGGDFSRTTDTTVEIAPYLLYDSMYLAGDTVRGFNTRFVRDLMPGDSIDVPGSVTTGIIEHVMSDTRLRMVSSWSKDTTVRWSGTKVRAVRTYPTGKGSPFLHQFGNAVYTGSVNMVPQMIYPTDSALYITKLGLVDSVTIDHVRTNFIDSLLGPSIDTSGVDTVIRWVQIVDRGHSFPISKYSSTAGGNNVTYYFRIGAGGGVSDTSLWGKMFEIVDNSDTAFILRRPLYNDSVRLGHLDSAGLRLSDSLKPGDMSGTIGYVYSATGLFREVYSESQCGYARVRGAGAVLTTTSKLLDTVNQDDMNYGMYYVQFLVDANATLIAKDPGVSVYGKNQVWVHTGDPSPQIDTSGGEYIVGVLRNQRILRLINGEWDWGPWDIYTVAVPYARYVSGVNLYNYIVPIMYSYWKRDSLFIVTAGGENAIGAVATTISHWRIVKSDIPMWSGITDFQNRLVGWGDSLSGSMINMSGVLEPHNWSPSGEYSEPHDLFLEHPEDPVYKIEPFDNQAVIFRKHTMLGYDGASFTQLSLSDGIVGRDASIVVGNFLYWVSKNGLNVLQRRDLTGYSVKNLSASVAPIFMAWNATVFGQNVVPYTVNQAYSRLISLGYNKRDDHLYIFFPNGSSTSNNRVMTYRLSDGAFDGVFLMSGTSPIWTEQADTSRIFFGSTSRARIYALDYVYNDTGSTGINGTLRSHEFYIPDQNGLPMKARLAKVLFVGRSLSGCMDSAFIDISGRDESYVSEDDMLSITRMSINSGWPSTYSGTTPQSTKFTYWPDSNNVASVWQWEIKTYGKSSASIFQPYLLQFHFVPIWRYD